MNKFTIIIMIATVIVTLTGCMFFPGNQEEPKTHDFQTSDDFLENPSILNAIDESGNFPINEGTDPPNIEGTYSLRGEVIDASSSELIGTPMQSTIRLYDQYSDRISIEETLGYIHAIAEGEFIIGKDRRFTTLQESQQEYGSAIMYITLLMSGVLDYYGNLVNVETLTVLTAAENLPTADIGLWYKGECELTLSSSNISRTIETAEQEAIGVFISKL